MPTQYVCVGNKGTLRIEEDHGARWLSSPDRGLMRDIAAPTEDPCHNCGGVLVLDGHRGQTLQLSAPSAARAILRWSSTILAMAWLCRGPTNTGK